MAEIRLLRPEELKEAVELSDRTFRDEDHISMGKAFPHVFFEGIGQSYGAFADGKLVAFVGFVPSVIRVGEASLNVFSVGSVCTHPDYRKKGYSSAILEKVMEHADVAGSSLILVSGERSLYTRANCFPFGTVRRYRVKPFESRSAEINIREAELRDCFQLKKLADSRTVRFEQSIWDLMALIHSEPLASCEKMNHKVWVAEKDGEIEAFLVAGVPYESNSEKQNLAIEWAGEARSVRSLMEHAARFGAGNELIVPVPSHMKALEAELEGAAYKSEKNLGTIHVVNSERLVSQLTLYFNKKNEELDFHVALQEDGRTEVSLNGQKAILDPLSFAQLLLNDEPDLSMDHRLKDSLTELFPVPLPYMGGLNYV